MRILKWPIHVSINLKLPAIFRRWLSRTIVPLTVDSVRIRHIVDSEPGEPDFLVAVLEFNNVKSDDSDPEHINLSELRDSIAEDGTFFIWTCACGAPSCAGMYDGVEVIHHDDQTTWHNRDWNQKFIFKTADLQHAFNCAIAEGQEFINHRPGLEAIPDQNQPVYDVAGD